MEQPIAFYSKALRDSTLKYDIMLKQAYSLVKYLKEFRIYISYSHIAAFVPSSIVKHILTQFDPEGRRSKWIVALLEYDQEIKPTKLIKAQGLAKLMAQLNYEALGTNFFGEFSGVFSQGEMIEVHPYFLASSWYKDLIYVLQKLQDLPGLSKTKAIFIKLKDEKNCIINEYLYWKDPRGVLLNCLLEKEAKKKIQDFH